MLLILAGVFISKDEATDSLWDENYGRPIFRSTMSLKCFKQISKILRFDRRSDREERHISDKLAAIREVWDKWVDLLPKYYNTGYNVTIDEQLVAFRG